MTLFIIMSMIFMMLPLVTETSILLKVICGCLFIILYCVATIIEGVYVKRLENLEEKIKTLKRENFKKD